jgi:ubiquinone biosynthesis protein UbiJ
VVVNVVLARLLNRVLRDYPLARERLAAHGGKTIAMTLGPAYGRLRITTSGEVGPVGEGAADEAAVSFDIPLALLPRLAAADSAAYHDVKFAGDSELAALLSELVRNLKWDVEEDLSRLVGDIAAHRVVDTARRSHAWRKDATQRLTENMAEYLTEEKRAFITADDLETLALENESLRDDVARLDARINKLTLALQKT